MSEIFPRAKPKKAFRLNVNETYFQTTELYQLYAQTCSSPVQTQAPTGQRPESYQPRECSIAKHPQADGLRQVVSLLIVVSEGTGGIRGKTHPGFQSVDINS